MVFNRPLTGEEIQLLNEWGNNPVPQKPTAALPAATMLEILAGAEIRFETANEEVSGIAGEGTIVLAGNASLKVSQSCAFSGTIAGSGKLSFGENVNFNLSESGVGYKTLLSAPKGVITMPASTEGWAVSGISNHFATDFRLKENEDGSMKMLQAKIATRGFAIIIK